jgi:glyoxylase-like metal-dependent hydrolase (beta-lactamase superfamily II)
MVDFPYLGFLLRQGKHTILVDAGISEKYISGGKGWGGWKTEGGKSYVEKALADAGISPEEIAIVIYTHLHNEHGANSTLFRNARLLVQKDEWETLLNPLPAMNVRRDYEQSYIQELSSMKLLKVEGDFEITDGIKIYKTPGHTPGSQSVAVNTKKGIVVLVGDQFILNCMAFPRQAELIDMQGNRHAITPAPEAYGPFMPSSVVYNYYDWYDSAYKVKAIAEADEAGFIIPGHEPSLLVTGI